MHFFFCPALKSRFKATANANCTELKTSLVVVDTREQSDFTGPRYNLSKLDWRKVISQCIAAWSHQLIQTETLLQEKDRIKNIYLLVLHPRLLGRSS